MLKLARSASSGAQGYFVVMTTVDGSGASMFLMATSRNSQPPSVLRALSSENLTSAEVIGEPLLNFTPCFSLNVQVSLSSDSVWLSASSGATSLPSGVTS